MGLVRSKTLVGYDKDYTIYEDGRLWRGAYKRSFNGGVRDIPAGWVPQSKTNGYLLVCLVKTCGEKTYPLVHRIVAEAFLPNPANLPQVNHRDEDRSNNVYTNLEWTTGQKNSEHSISRFYIVTHPNGKLEQVFNMEKFCRNHGLRSSTMCKVANGVMVDHKGFKVIYENNLVGNNRRIINAN